MSDQLKDFLKKNDVKLERPATEWAQISARLPRQSWSWGPLKLREWFSGVRLALSGGLVAAGIAVMILAPWEHGNEERAAAVLDDTLGYLAEVGGGMDYFGD
jgi:hypothetical protein